MYSLDTHAFRFVYSSRKQKYVAFRETIEILSIKILSKQNVNNLVIATKHSSLDNE